jgi:(E)-4-hydroxy-3-methylbut-2-enyl-diphosphate synthase
MKASNAQVAIQAYRLLAARLAERRPGETGYPFHVGVTEAGDGEDGRIKSAIGIGALLEDGLGDTIRVSLTEDPVKEVPVAVALARRAEAHWARRAPAPADPGAPFCDDPYSHRRRATRSLGALGGANPVRVELALGPVPADPRAAVAEIASSLAAVREVSCEGICFDVHDVPDRARLAELGAALRERALALPIAVRAESRLAVACADAASRLVVAVGSLIEDAELAAVASTAVHARIPVEWELRGPLADVPALTDRALAASRAGELEDFAISVDAGLAVHAARAAAARLRACGAADVPIVLRHRRHPEADETGDLLDLAVDLGAPLCDGIGDAVVLDGFPDAGRATDLAYRVLQGARLRTTRTEFISCPSCGRTLFDLEETTARIKARTSHLVGLKIAVMGCIVNGPGEMADADFGYVGSGPGTVNLFVGHECVERHVPAAEATDRLVALIRSYGRWVDPPADLPS